jgi:hypothetical protein
LKLIRQWDGNTKTYRLIKAKNEYGKLVGFDDLKESVSRKELLPFYPAIGFFILVKD